MLLQPSRAPGRDAPGAPPPAPPAPPADGPAAAGSAQPQNAAAPAPGPFDGMGIMLPMLIVVFGLFWWMNRSEKKKRSQLEEQLKKGDKVLTRAGFIGKLVEVGETRCRVELAPGVNVTMVKQAIEGLADDEKKEPAKDDKAKDDKALVASDKSDTDSKTDRKKKKK